MSYLVLHADRLATALADDPVVPAQALPQLRDALGLFAEAGRLREESDAAVESARARGHAEGVEAGRAEGRAEAQAELRAELFRLAMRDGEERRTRRSELSNLALEIVRRIAGEIGSDALVAGMAERAAARLVPDTAATVRVAPTAVEAVRTRLTGRAGLTVEGDASVPLTDCVVETALGRDHAGLETQLAQIERAWGERAT